MEGRRTSPIDEGNLNRSFPGDADGTITQQIAYFIEHPLLPGFDYSFDFHSGGSSLTYIPSALAPSHEDGARLQKVIGMLKAFGAPVSYLAAAPPGRRQDLHLGLGAPGRDLAWAPSWAAAAW